jgi:biopolymer transport protein ExbB/TolQ
MDRAVKFCMMAPKTPLARVVQAGLTSAPRGELEVAKSIEEAILEFTPKLSTRISWLWSIANVATLFGLIGTITGLIETFRSLTNLPAEKKQELLSNGISTAMNNTAFGLLIAVTCIIFHLVLSSYSKKLVDSVELSAVKLENLLGRTELSAPAELERSA